MTFGKLIQTYRLKRDLTIRELHLRTGLTVAGISHIEHDRRTPLLSTAMKLVSALQIPPDELGSIEIREPERV